ncbi:pentapeptide repeat-containing protein [Nitrosomonas ureae]|uniref:Uncharacterized protein YjbI with pentapeptide repeats n=1 Tax=Nitrosomonas ureae TaxID=44577 RepID=A0A2T5IVA0_9PROT|nr:pentapeptide repeat-containing protein [Nitrosomonas ureae]PTQ87812.1 uncharacterized protein YjbI with pentapeptide repeats [Nitrosomonas ureae]
MIPEYHGYNFSRCNLNRASLRNCTFTDCDFSESHLHFADLVDSLHQRSNFSGAGLNVSKIGSAKFVDCNFSDAQLSYCTAEETSFVGAQLIRTKMDNMSLVKTDFSNAVIDGVFVYGTSTWDLKLEGATQQNIYISSESLTITVPDLELAQFIALLVRNSNIRKIIDTITSKVVLILGRFTPERKTMLDAIKVEIQTHGFLPVLFDFEGPQSRDLTETVTTLASMSRFVVADISGAKSVPQELSVIVPHFPSLPVQPIIQDGELEYGMFEHFERYPWVLEKLIYTPSGVGALVESVIENCEKRRARE